MPGEQGQHMVEERDPGFNGRFARAVNLESEGDAGLLGDPAKLGPAFFHLHRIKPDYAAGEKA